LKPLLHWIRIELGAGRGFCAMAAFLLAGQVFELWALSSFARMVDGQIELAAILTVAALFLVKASIILAGNLLSSSILVRLRFRVRETLFAKLDLLDFLHAQRFASDRLGFVGRHLPESIFNLMNGVMQFGAALFYLAALFVILWRVNSSLAWIGFAATIGMAVISLLIHRFLRHHALKALDWEAGHELRWSERISLWKERRLLGLSGAPKECQSEVHAHHGAIINRDLWRVIQAPALEVFFIFMLLTTIVYLQSQGQSAFATVVTCVLFLQRIQGRAQSCLVAVQQIRDEWPVWLEAQKYIGELPLERTNFSKCDFSGVDVENLEFSYASKNLIGPLSFSARPGEWIRIDGENSSGKSTLCQLIAGLLRPGIGLIQSPRAVMVTGVTTIVSGGLVENLDLGRLKDSKDIQRRLCAFGLWDRLNALDMNYLSAGEKQMIGLGRALIGLAPVLILDEATTHLSEALEAEVLMRLRRIEPQLIVFIVSHRPSIGRFCDRVIRLDPESTLGLVEASELDA